MRRHRLYRRYGHATKAKSVSASRLQVGDTIRVPTEFSMDGKTTEDVVIVEKRQTVRHFSRGTAFDLIVQTWRGETRKIFALGNDRFERLSKPLIGPQRS
jgi:hypothetical protein